jgi:hypothetical protein
MKDTLDNNKIFQLYIENTIIRESMRPTLGSPGEVSFMIEGILKRAFWSENKKEYNLTLQAVQFLIARWLEPYNYSDNSNIYINSSIMESVERGHPESNFNEIFPLRLVLVDPEKTSAYHLSISYGSVKPEFYGGGGAMVSRASFPGFSLEGNAQQREISTGDIKENKSAEGYIFIGDNSYKNIYSR